jgi:hypothetical protein
MQGAGRHCGEYRTFELLTFYLEQLTFSFKFDNVERFLYTPSKSLFEEHNANFTPYLLSILLDRVT